MCKKTAAFAFARFRAYIDMSDPATTMQNRGALPEFPGGRSEVVRAMVDIDPW